MKSDIADMSPTFSSKYKIDDLTLDGGTRSVMRGATVLKLSSLTFDFLVALVEAAPNIATYDHVAERVWNGLSVSPETIAQRASMLRRALSDDPKTPRYFEAVRGVGFRINASIASLPNGRTKNVSKAQRTIAVLPFANLSDKRSHDYFGDGLVEDIISDLSQIPQLLVISRNSTFVYKDSAVSIAEISEGLGVSFILRGSIRRFNDRLRITAQLVDVETEQNIWSKKYDRDLTEIFALQDDLTKEIVTALDIELVSGEQGRHRRSKYRSAEAGEVLYKGMYQHYKFEQSAAVKARALFKEFVRLEPESVIGHAWLALAWGFALVVRWEKPEVAMPQLKMAIDNALAIDSNDPQTLVSDTYFRVISGDVGGAVRSAENATRVSPNLDDAWFALGWAQMFVGDSQSSIESLTRAIRLSPIPTTLRLGVLGTAYRNVGRYDDAIDTFNMCIERFPDFIFAHAGLAVVYGLKGDDESAKEKVREVVKMDPQYSVERFTRPDFYHDKAVMEKCGEVLSRAGMPVHP